MRNILKRIIKSFRSTRYLFNLQQLDKNYLSTTGWSQSALWKTAIDANGDPIPWLTYPAIHFLSQRLDSDKMVFEYGSGNSTLWFSAHCKSVCSVEHDAIFYETLQKKVKGNNKIQLKQVALDEQQYPSSIELFDGPFDVIVIDGRFRNRCAKCSLSKLSKRGIIVFDNSERPYYKEGREFLNSHDLKEIQFRGLTPGSTGGSQTSVFYRSTSFIDV